MPKFRFGGIICLAHIYGFIMKYKSSFYTFFTLIVLLFLEKPLTAQYTPYFQNIDLGGLEVHNQNWDITQGESGRIFVANNNGLLIYDGLHWELKHLPNRTIIRSIYAFGNKVYTGSYQEFGYWQSNAFGQWEYHSLTQKEKTLSFYNQDFWQITSIGERIFFRSFEDVYVFYHNKITPLKSPSTVISISKDKGELFVATLYDGILRLEGDSLVPFINDTALEETKVISVKPMPNGNFFIATELKGCFVWNGEEMLPYESEVNELLKNYQLNKICYLPKGEKAFGTIQSGVYLVNSHGKITEHIRKKNGLSDNTVLALFLTNSHTLWLGLNKGISSVDLESNIKVYHDLEGKIGAVYDVVQHNDITYIGSNTGLYYLDGERLAFVQGTQGQVWDLKKIEGDLLCGHNSGTFLVKDKIAQKISPYTGGWRIKKIPNTAHSYLQGSYGGLVKFKKTKGEWSVKHIGEPLIPIRYFEFEDKTHAWVAHFSKGLYRLSFNASQDSITKQKAYLEGQDFKVEIHKIGNEIVFSTINGWYKYDSLKDELIPYNYLNSIFGTDKKIISTDDLDFIALKGDNILDFRKITDLKKSLFSTDQYFKKHRVIGFENLSAYNDSLLSFNLNDGYLILNKKRLIAHQKNIYPPVIESLNIDGKHQLLEKDNTYTIPNKHNQILIAIGSPKSRHYFIEYKGVSSEKWTHLKSAFLELSHLKSGENEIQVRTANFFGEHSLPITLQLDVSPPWYLSTWAWLSYALALILLIFLLYYLHRKKVTREQMRVVERFRQQQKELIKEQKLLNEKKIIEVKNETLKKEVHKKSKELANNAMALVKKNEALLELKEELNTFNKNQMNASSLNKILRKIDKSLGKKSEWEVFENNFNQVHEEFFAVLKEKHPQLNARDLKLSAYIKMNLLTKEIAPLMGISIRGVETHRYRLKQKMNLDKNTSLTEYLLKT